MMVSRRQRKVWRARVALFLWLLVVAFSALALVLAFGGEAPGFEVWGFRGALALLGFSYGSVGIVVLNRRPGNRIAWLFLLVGLLTALQAFVEEYAVLALLRAPGVWPAGAIAGWVVNWIWLPSAATLPFTLLFFPDGRLPGRRWRYVIWLELVLVLAATALLALAPGPLESSFPAISNPLGQEWLRPLRGATALLGPLTGLSLFGAAAAAVVVRWRRSRGVERQQMKWFAFAISMIAVTSFGGLSGISLFESLFIASTILLPVTTGVAIVRYRLWDIDRIISRTVGYTLLTGALAFVYFGAVILLQGLLAPFAGANSTLAIVLSTLAIAALFNPLRRRMQRFIDRRFYRRRIDAAQALARFAETARDEVDLDELTKELLAVVVETMQPTHVSLMLKRGSDGA